jgi:hypothetical protein
VANSVQLLPIDVQPESLFSGLLLVDMNDELINRGTEGSLAGKDLWERAETPETKRVNDPTFTPQQCWMSESWYCVRSHDYSPLND